LLGCIGSWPPHRIGANHQSGYMSVAIGSVLHVLAPAQYGGLEQVVRSLVAGQAAAGLDPRVLAIVEPHELDHPFVATLRAAGRSVDTLPVAPRRYMAERWGVAQWCLRTRPSVVHVHGARPDVLVGGAVRGAGFPVVSTVHGFTGGDLKNRFYEVLQRRALRGMDAVVAVSRPLARELVASGVRSRRMHVVPNAAPPGRDRPSRSDARRTLGIPPDACVIGFVGRLTREKGCDLFLAAMAATPARVSASVIGSGREQPTLERAAQEAGLTARIRWHGAVESAGRLLAAFDAVVISSRTEGTPMLLFEAIQAGVPVVAAAVGGIPDVISDAEAILVPPGDTAELARAILRTIDDPGTSAQRVARARARVAAEFSLERWVDQYSAVYQAALEAR
jgi:glycosyltransferase involved in cell wall biosynthesis